jgi:hypothetical protein
MYEAQRETYIAASAHKTHGFMPARATATEMHFNKNPDRSIEMTDFGATSQHREQDYYQTPDARKKTPIFAPEDDLE